MHASPDLRSQRTSHVLQWRMVPNQSRLSEVRSSISASDTGTNGRANYTFPHSRDSLCGLVQQGSVKWLEKVWMAGIATRLAVSTRSTATRASAAFARL